MRQINAMSSSLAKGSAVVMHISQDEDVCNTHYSLYNNTIKLVYDILSGGI
jgi:hypothetical protein